MGASWHKPPSSIYCLQEIGFIQVFLDISLNFKEQVHLVANQGREGMHKNKGGAIKKQ